MALEELKKSQLNVQGVHIDVPMTELSIAYMQEDNDFVSDKVFPIVPVKQMSNKYYKFPKSYWFRSEAKKRAEGTESAGGGFALETGNYNCEVYAFHVDVTEQERANADFGIDIDTTSTLFVTSQLQLIKEKEFANAYFKAGVWGRDFTGVETEEEVTDTNKFICWDKDGSDPYQDIRVGRMHIKKTTGYRPNKLVIAEEVFEVLKMHPKVKEMYKYTNADSITTEMLAKYFGVKEVLVAGAIENIAGEGAEENMQFFLNNGVLLTYAAKKPGLRIPTGGYTFSWIGGDMAGYSTVIRKIPMPWLRADRIEGETAFQHGIVAKDLGVFYSNVLSA